MQLHPNPSPQQNIKKAKGTGIIQGVFLRENERKLGGGIGVSWNGIGGIAFDTILAKYEQHIVQIANIGLDIKQEKYIFY